MSSDLPPILSIVGNASANATASSLRELAGLRYVARQPIFDREEKVFGYELLFRDGLHDTFSGDTDEASRATLDSSLVMGIDVLCDGRRAFVNCTRDTLIKGLVTLLPPKSTVVEVLESVPADPDVIAACHALKDAGYTIALDDYLADDPREPLAEIADIIKIEMQLTKPDSQAALMKKHGRCRMLAEKIETYAEFEQARNQGFAYFQGYFFRRPEMMTMQDMPANRLNYLRMLQEVSRPDLDLPALEKLIKAEASVCYRLLRYLNSAVFGLKTEIHSVRHALSMLGERDVRRWVRLVAAVGAGHEKTSDLVLSSLVRGKFGELLSPRVKHGESDLFLLGLLSLIDAMLETPMSEVLEKLPLDRETKAVLMGQPSALRPVFQLMLAHESGEWAAAADLSKGLHLESEDVAGYYWQAQQWARELSVD
ncbi:MAG TPA: HDOD domain-containing protein [Candidatus Sulfotelmatobacter sp.]|nr:HDOD domain-containing protein [Candidatus Sulfotelmatobacter sp.]